jgi:hypothetical protein
MGEDDGIVYKEEEGAEHRIFGDQMTSSNGTTAS